MSKERIIGMVIGLALALVVVWIGKAVAQPKLAILGVFLPVAGVFVGDHIRRKKEAKEK